MPETIEPVIYQFRVVLRRVSPMIWRGILVRSESSIADLHYTIQIAIGWSDSHLHRFRIYSKDFGVYHIGGPIFDDNAQKVRLAGFRLRLGERFLYEYDFGDNWQHDVRLERILPLDQRQTYPICIGGKRSAPPEDCGGAWRFYPIAPTLFRGSRLERADGAEGGSRSRGERQCRGKYRRDPESVALA